MAVTSQESTEYTNVYTTSPPTKNPASDWHGRLRIAVFTHDQSGAGDATSSVAICKLPPGKVRIFGKLSHAYINWTTASATIDFGWDAYNDFDGTAVAADPDGLDNGVSVESAGNINFCSVLATGGYMKSFESRDGVVLRLTSQDTAIVSGDDAVGVIVYSVD